jgi:hypothetical protein
MGWDKNGEVEKSVGIKVDELPEKGIKISL